MADPRTSQEILEEGLTCTECGEMTGDNPDFGDRSMPTIIAIISQWKCTDCLDDRSAFVRGQLMEEIHAARITPNTEEC